jgi:hypothetical protein
MGVSLFQREALKSRSIMSLHSISLWCKSPEGTDMTLWCEPSKGEAVTVVASNRTFSTALRIDGILDPVQR